jgi:hypothetical protein
MKGLVEPTEARISRIISAWPKLPFACPRAATSLDHVARHAKKAWSLSRSAFQPRVARRQKI